MANNSDIIKIGFDYRSSLAQFEKETNGVFDGISEKAGKQKIVIQLDAKNDKVIEKIKELQKLKLDKFTFEFGDSGIKEQLKTFGQLENKINEIINLSKGIGGNQSPIIDVKDSAVQIDKLQSKLDELTKKYDELSNKKIGGNVSGKDINLVDNDEFKKLSESFEKIKGEVDDLKTHMTLLDDYTVDSDSFLKLETQVDGLSVKIDNLIDKYVELANVQKNIGTDKSNTTNIINETSKELEKLSYGSDNYHKTVQEVTSAIVSMNEKGKNETKEYYQEVQKLFDLYELWRKEADIPNNLPQNKKFESFIDNEQLNAGFNIDDTMSDIFKACIIIEDDFIDSSTNKFIKLGNLIKNAVSEPISEASIGNKSNISSPIKDVFQGNDKATTDASTTAIKEESQALEQVSTSAKDAANAKEKFADANKEVKTSAESSSTSLDEEKKKIENVGDSAEETKKKLDDVVFKPNTEGFDEIVSKLDIAKDKIEEISKITKSSVWSESQGEYLESYNIKYKNGTSEIRGESSNKKGSNVLRANEVAYDAKAEEQAAKERLNSEQKVQAQKDAFHKKNLTAIDLEIQKREEESKMFSSALKAQMEERQKDISSMESSLKSFNESSNQLSAKPDDQHQFSSWKKQLEDLNIKIAEYKSKVENLSKIDIADEEQIKKAKTEIEELGNSIKETINAMTKTPQTKRGWTDIGASKAAEKIANVLKQNTKMSKEATDAIRAYYNELRSGNPSQPIDEILVKVNQLVQKERELGRVGKSFGEIFKEKVIYGGAAQLAGMVGFYDVINVIKQAASTVTELNRQITELAKVSEQSSKQIYTDFDSYADIAKEVRGTISDTITATADWSKNGYSIPDAKQLAEISQLYKNVGDGIDIDVANESLISTLKGFQLEADQAEHIVDVFNEVSNNESISSGGIGEALQRSAASFNAASTSLEKSVSLVTATNSVLQDPEKVGKQILAYLYSNVMKIKVAISVKILRRTRPRKDYNVCFNY